MSKYKIGEIIYGKDLITINHGKEATKVIVTNNGDRPVQVGSHYHFFECNFAIAFDRELAYGKHLDIPSGTAMRFEPGEEKEVSLVTYSGDQIIMGFNGLTMGQINDPAIRSKAMEKMMEKVRGV